MAAPALPSTFADLEGFVGEWALPSQEARYRRRIRASMAELKAFYDAMLPRMPAIADYLNAQPLEGLPEDARRLMLLSFSFIEAAMAVELFNEPDESRALPADRFRIVAGSGIGA